MQTTTLSKRLRKAAENKSLRELAKQCGVSHELIRKLVKADAEVSLTIASYNKIDKGLQNDN